MKKILQFLALFLIVFYSTVGNSQITAYTLCDEDMDGIVIFDLTTKIPEALGDLDPDDHIVTFHQTYSAALNNNQIIENPEIFFFSLNVQTLGVRIENSIDSSVEITILDVRKIPAPIINQTINLGSFNGYFDLTENASSVTAEQYVTIYYFPTEEDADNDTNPIIDPTNYFASNSVETVWIKAAYPPNGGVVCSTKASFTINTINVDQISELGYCDPNSDGFGLFDLTLKIDEILNGADSSNYMITFYETENDAQYGVNALQDFLYITILPYIQTMYVRVEDMNGAFEIGSFDLIVYALPEIGTAEDLYSPNAVFDLTDNDLIVNITENPDYVITYHLTLQDAQHGTESLTNTTSYTIPVGISQPVWVRVQSPYNSCVLYESFHLITEHSTITGKLSFDINNDGICDENDSSQSFIKINVSNTAEQDFVFSDASGNYVFYNTEAQATYTLTPELENPALFNINPAQATVSFPLTESNEGIVNFCITPNGTQSDVEVVIAPITLARPGFEATYKIIYRNKGNQIVSGSIDFEFDNTRLDFVSSNPIADSQSTGLFSYDFTGLNPFEQRSITIKLDVNSPTDTPSVNIDDILPFVAEITINQTDINIDDNTYEFNQVVVGSYDPNDITCIEGEIVHPDYIGEELHYLIRFENTGNFYAENVVVAVEIDTEKYDINSLQILNTSHISNARIADNTLEIFFNQIYLNPEAQGDILFVVNTKDSLSEGDSVQSKADIYFDFNYPIITNDAVTLFQATMNIEENIKNIDLKFYPNPTTDYFNITSEAMIQSVELYDVSGRLVRTSLVNDFETQQNVINLNNGVYILKIKTHEGEVTGKIVKK